MTEKPIAVPTGDANSSGDLFQEAPRESTREEVIAARLYDDMQKIDNETSLQSWGACVAAPFTKRFPEELLKWFRGAYRIKLDQIREDVKNAGEDNAGGQEEIVHDA